jgi:serine/threonine protein kinase
VPALLFLQPSVEIADMPPKKRDRCIKEVQLLQQLSHPNIITMFDAFVDQDQLVIITEWAPGGVCCCHVREQQQEDSVPPCLTASAT